MLIYNSKVLDTAGREKQHEEVDDDLNVCVLNLPFEVSTLPSLVDISLMKVEL